MHDIIVRNATHLACDLLGDEHAPLAILVSGAGAPAAFWPVPFCQRLAASGLFVVRYSHRDTGLSTHYAEPYVIDELVQDLHALIAALGRSRAHVIGHSMGGHIAQIACCRLPEIVASVTSISAGSTVAPELYAELGMSSVPDATWQVLMQNQPSGDLDLDLPGWLVSWRFLNGARAFDEDMADAYTRSLYGGDPRNCQVATNHIHAMSTVPRSLIEDLADVTCPFLVIHGTDDVLVPMDHGEATARLVPTSNVVRLERAGHMFFSWDTWAEIETCVVSHTRPR